MEIRFRTSPLFFRFGVAMASHASGSQPPKRPTFIRRILLVDDARSVLRAGEAALKSIDKDYEAIKIDLTKPIKEQVMRLVREQTFQLIVLNGLLTDKAAGGGTLFGSDLVRELRAAKFEAFIIANSSDQQERRNII